MKNYLLFLLIFFKATISNGQTIPTKSTSDTLNNSKYKSLQTNWTIDFAQFPLPNTTLVDLNDDHRYRISYNNSLRKDISTIVVVYLSNKRPGLNRVELSKGNSIDIECYRIIIENYLYMPGQVNRCYEGCPNWKDCVCAYTGTIMALD